MGSPIAQVAPSTQPQGKGFASPQPQSNQQPNLLTQAGSFTQQNASVGQSVMDSIRSVQPGQISDSALGQESSSQQAVLGNAGANVMSSGAQPIGPLQQSSGKGSRVTFPGQGGQPRMGQPNMYPNTVGQWDNASIQPQQSRNSGGKGKG